ncbi:MAG: protein jag [Clostridia bacterium]|nr:protein jag [Clostridia bacterium]
MGLAQEDVDIEVVDEGTKGFLGLGSKDAKIVVTVKEPVPCMAKAFLSKIFKGMNLEVDIKTTLDGDNLLIDLSGEHMGIIIGKRGDTLDSLQYLTSLVVNKGGDNYIKVTLDTENYREKRYVALIALSERLAAKVIKSGKKYTLEPMNPYERRIIHSTLQTNEEVTTFSIGEDPYRKVVIAPKNPVRPSYTKKSYSSYTPTHNRDKEKKHSDFESYIQEHTSEETEE